MREYNKEDVLQIAKRLNNTKRSYLLVDPLQGKHIPISPSASFEMMESLGQRLKEKYKGDSLVIAFAETATAIGTRVALTLGDNCRLIHTTREEIEGIKWLNFNEEHSHAVEQRVSRDYVAKAIGQVENIIFIDDEISTGKTLVNIINSLRAEFSEIKDKTIVVASIINRVSDANMEIIKGYDIFCEYLLKLPEENYDSLLSEGNYQAPIKINNNEPVKYITLYSKKPIPNARLGTKAGDYYKSCKVIAEDIVRDIDVSGAKSALVLGTEECMFPSMVVGKALEDEYGIDVWCHSTTRSPISVLPREGYPVQNGYELHSFYDKKRVTYIYNIRSYDVAIVVTDAKEREQESERDLFTLLKSHGISRLYHIRIGEGFGTYLKDDVTILLKDITGMVEPLPTGEREKRIQSGTHYSEMLPIEYEPSEKYFKAYKNALYKYAPLCARAVATASERIIKEKGKDVSLVSLARAGTPIGILIKRYIKAKYGIDVEHYTVSIIRGRGIDKNAMEYILSRHKPEKIKFIDGWTGKGAIQKELDKAMKEYPLVDSTLAVLADPAHIAGLCGTYEDFLIASSCLNSTVSGLLSRTLYRSDVISEKEFHGSAFYRELSASDVTYEFIEEIEKHFPSELEEFKEDNLKNGGIYEVEKIAGEFNVSDINLVKPGIGEATRVLLRRVPWKLLVHSLKDEEHLGHLYQLAKEKGVEVVEYPLECYRACGIIKSLADN